MATASDLEVVLAWRADQNCFELSIAFDDPDDSGDRRRIWPAPIVIDTDRLRPLRHDPAAYGRALTDQIFGGEEAEELREFYRQAKAWAQSEDLPLRVRLTVDQDAPAAMQDIRWETLLEPGTDNPLALRTDVWFSRHLSSADWTRVKPPGKHRLRALVVIANPSGLENIGADPPLAPVDVDAEVARAEAALAGIRHEFLPSDGKATLDNIVNALDRRVDILYLVCHGFFDRDDEPRIVLEDGNGEAWPVAPSELADKIKARRHKPVLAALCSCQSAGAAAAETSDEGALAPLGPELARAGVASVIAMQHNVTMQTAGTFFTRFFEEVDRDGIVDRAVAAARIALADAERPDWWVPVLFTRLKRGRAYYDVGFSGDQLKVNQFVSKVKNHDVTPVLGPGLAEPLIGARADLASKWVERWLLPIAEPDNEDLTTVGQFVQAGTTAYGAQEELSNYLISELERDKRYASIDRSLFTGDDHAALFKEIGRRARENNPEEPHAVMAGLNLPVYITTSWTDLLSDALEALGREPQVRSFIWNEDLEDLPPQAPIDKPTPERPLVYHLYGQLDVPASMVLTEDDYFQWLAKWAELRQEKTPGHVIDALTTKPLMFVGYRLHDWDFRVLFQGLRNFRGHYRFRRRPHIGVQVDPNAPGVEPEAAQEYLDKYFAEGGITIFWGKTEEFLSELTKRMSRL
ncbi:MAG: hypothetical protein QOJ29_3504 [Thermoleophilaceae bacterium]|jgi:hypothetical protein|nr:hypothetical protein [Thermoleophilaceae bacterium]